MNTSRNSLLGQRKSGTPKLADVNPAGQFYVGKVVDELILLRHAAATHLRYQESVEDHLRAGDTEVALNILAQQRRNLTVAIERTGKLIGGKYADLHSTHIPDDTAAAIAAARKQAQP